MSSQQLLGKRCGVVINKEEERFEPLEIFCQENEIPVLLHIPYEKEFAALSADGQLICEKSEEARELFAVCFERLEAQYEKAFVLSGKGGTGKTTTAAALIRFSKAKAIADCDVDAPNLHLVTAQTGNPEVTQFLGGEKAEIDPCKCTGCGLCQSHCRFDAIREKDGTYAG